jgi:flagellar protein FliS
MAMTQSSMHPYPSTDAYRDSAVLTAGPEQLVVLLFEGAVRFGRQAQAALEAGQERQAFNRIERVVAILDELLATLDLETGGELAERLQALYVWCRRCLIEARVERSVAKVGHVVRLLDELRDAWARAATGAAIPA